MVLGDLRTQLLDFTVTDMTFGVSRGPPVAACGNRGHWLAEQGQGWDETTCLVHRI